MATAQKYTDLFPDSRAPYRFRIYEKEVLQKKEVLGVDTFHVWKWMNAVWMQGLYKYEGDTTKLVFTGWQQDNDQKGPLGKIWYRAYKYYDTIYVVPSLEGFEMWKKERGYK